jgi:hypothetical protein
MGQGPDRALSHDSLVMRENNLQVLHRLQRLHVDIWTVERT